MEITLKEIQPIYRLTLNETEDRVYVKPIDRYSFTSYPLPENLEGCILLTKEEYLGFMSGFLIFNEDLTGVEYRTLEPEI